jgi:hypothetical protein
VSLTGTATGHASLSPKRRFRLVKPAILALLLLIFLGTVGGSVGFAYADLTRQIKSSAYELGAKSDLGYAAQQVYLDMALNREPDISRFRNTPEVALHLSWLDRGHTSFCISARHQQDDKTYYLDSRSGRTSLIPCTRKA